MGIRRIIVTLLAACLAGGLGACQQAAIDENKQLIEQQQAQIEQMQQQIATLTAQRTYSSVPPPPGACDSGVMAEASRRGGEKFAAGDLQKALGYYQDALTACPGNPKAELNVARSYEALGNRSEAIAHYRQASASADPAEHDAEEAARSALERLAGS
jgi:tetratricopeptide (TPR) repeat protein